MITDRNGHTYSTRQEVLDAIAYLDDDAAYLREAAKAYSNQWVRERVESNARNSQAYADELRAALEQQPQPEQDQ